MHFASLELRSVRIVDSSWLFLLQPRIFHNDSRSPRDRDHRYLQPKTGHDGRTLNRVTQRTVDPRNSGERARKCRTGPRKIVGTLTTPVPGDAYIYPIAGHEEDWNGNRIVGVPSWRVRDGVKRVSCRRRWRGGFRPGETARAGEEGFTGKGGGD